MSIIYIPPHLRNAANHHNPDVRKQALKMLDTWYGAWLTEFKHSWDTSLAKHYFGYYTYGHSFYPSGDLAKQLNEYLDRQ